MLGKDQITPFCPPRRRCGVRVGLFMCQGRSREQILPLRRHCEVGILKQKPYNFTTNTLKAYLSAQASSLSAFVISKTHVIAQKPRGRQLNGKVCGSESAIFLILSSLRLFAQTTITRKRLKYSP